MSSHDISRRDTPYVERDAVPHFALFNHKIRAAHEYRTAQTENCRVHHVHTRLHPVTPLHRARPHVSRANECAHKYSANTAHLLHTYSYRPGLAQLHIEHTAHTTTTVDQCDVRTLKSVRREKRTNEHFCGEKKKPPRPAPRRRLHI